MTKPDTFNLARSSDGVSNTFNIAIMLKTRDAPMHAISFSFHSQQPPSIAQKTNTTITVDIHAIILRIIFNTHDHECSTSLPDKS